MRKKPSLSPSGGFFVVVSNCPLIFCNARAKTNQHNLHYQCQRGKEGRHVGITEWVLVWLIVNALFVVWRALGVSYEMETRDRSTRKMPTVADL